MDIAANVGDEIVFTISAPGAGQNYYPVLYNTVLDNAGVRSLGPNTAVWTNYDLASGGSGQQPAFSNTIPAGYPGAGNPNTFICAQWLFQVNGVGQTQYNMSFAVLNTQTGAVEGYYIWDPFVNVSN